jgi:hypothetical protein
MPGAATQVFSREFDAVLARVPGNISAVILGKITEMGGDWIPSRITA